MLSTSHRCIHPLLQGVWSHTYAVSMHFPSLFSLTTKSSKPFSMSATTGNGRIKGVVNCQNSRDKGPPEGNSARG